MKKHEIIFLVLATALFLPFFVSESRYTDCQTFNTTHDMMMAFVKFTILAAIGELLGLRHSTDVHHTPPLPVCSPVWSSEDC